jgi:hypothetical protein
MILVGFEHISSIYDFEKGSENWLNDINRIYELLDVNTISTLSKIVAK